MFRMDLKSGGITGCRNTNQNGFILPKPYANVNQPESINTREIQPMVAHRWVNAKSSPSKSRHFLFQCDLET